jgi:hypothetical protein
MDAGNNDVYLLQHRVGEIQRSISKNIYFYSCKYSDVIELLAGLTNLLSAVGTLIVNPLAKAGSSDDR